MKWINIKDKLPVGNVMIKLKWNDNSTGYGYLCKCCKKEFRSSMTGNSYSNDPTHWQPLPLSPKRTK